MKKVIRMRAPLLRYRPHWRKSPAPKAYDVSVSCAVFIPISTASIITAQHALARPTTARLIGSGMRAAKRTMVMLQKKASIPVMIDGTASFAKVFIIMPVVGCYARGLKKFNFSSPLIISSSFLIDVEFGRNWRVCSFSASMFILLTF